MIFSLLSFVNYDSVILVLEVSTKLLLLLFDHVFLNRQSADVKLLKVLGNKSNDAYSYNLLNFIVEEDDWSSKVFE